MINKIIKFYIEGFRNMTWGKSLWLIIFIKLFIMFVIFKAIFFPKYLNQFESDEAKAKHVIEEITTKN